MKTRSAANLQTAQTPDSVIALSGAVLVETVFAWPGLGTLAFQSILARDTPTILGILFFSALIVITGNLLTDLVLRLVDPRMRAHS
ncbi:ABC transporter permease subunit [Sedimentitalea todarodis]|uniref:ABC transporter permease subunit n=1 Tax=Sedimentitalea todarodis TaxID=1631240 RepID=A0ABU3V886_9RHOB|nr:ABC transporter permease subunit [Sedimentitalea todarodis]MDU9002396.1 ABC transporter permease subunit [Sedimentitalea todarodis]